MARLVQELRLLNANLKRAVAPFSTLIKTSSRMYGGLLGAGAGGASMGVLTFGMGLGLAGASEDHPLREHFATLCILLPISGVVTGGGLGLLVGRRLGVAFLQNPVWTSLGIGSMHLVLIPIVTWMWD